LQEPGGHGVQLLEQPPGHGHQCGGQGVGAGRALAASAVHGNHLEAYRWLPGVTIHAIPVIVPTTSHQQTRTSPLRHCSRPTTVCSWLKARTSFDESSCSQHGWALTQAPAPGVDELWCKLWRHRERGWERWAEAERNKKLRRMSQSVIFWGWSHPRFGDARPWHWSSSSNQTP
jgi:hypothetical protein